MTSGRAGEGHRAEVEKAIRFLSGLSFVLLFSLKICEIKEQVGRREMLTRGESHWDKKRVSRKGKQVKLFCLSDWGN